MNYLQPDAHFAIVLVGEMIGSASMGDFSWKLRRRRVV